MVTTRVAVIVLIGLVLVNARFHLSNMNDLCIRCLCNVNGCDMNRGCSNGLCGPFYLPKVYWDDAGRPTQPGDSHDSVGAFENCTADFDCSVRTMMKYWEKYGRDCNSDGVTDCFDYMMVNHNGGPVCTPPLANSARGRDMIESYSRCVLE